MRMEISRPSLRTRSACDRLSFDLLLLFEAVRENPKPADGVREKPLCTLLSEAVRVKLSDGVRENPPDAGCRKFGEMASMSMLGDANFELKFDCARTEIRLR